MTTYEPRYWNNRGRFQAEYERLFDALVPNEGQADTRRGEILRIVSRFGYDYLNNGGCNLKSAYFKQMGKRLIRLIGNRTTARNRALHFISGYANYRTIDLMTDWAVVNALIKERASAQHRPTKETRR